MLAQEVDYFPGTTHKIVQLTGECDKARRIPTLSRTKSNFGASGTDLGSSFEHVDSAGNHKLYFLFGDTPPDQHDFMAWTEATRPEDVVLAPCEDGPKSVHPITIPVALIDGVVHPEVKLGGLEVPSYGISVGGRIFIVVTTDATSHPDNMGRSVMAVSDDDGKHFRQLYDLSTDNFINVSMVEVDGRNFPNALPPEPCVLIWGSGEYHRSDVRLAYVPSAQIANTNNGNPDKSAIRYLVLPGAAPRWSTNGNEHAAGDLFNPSEHTVGEFSVQYCEQLKKWFMLYGANPFGAAHDGIHMRSADKPWGPWSQPICILDYNDMTNRDHAWGQYLHRPALNGENFDVFNDQPYAPDSRAGIYGPYMIPRFFRGNENRVTIVYTVSTWNPYQAVLMQSDIGYPARVHETITSNTTMPGDLAAGWTSSPKDFLHSSLPVKGVPYVTTHGSKGDADMGVAQYGFLTGRSDLALELTVLGGDGEVVLIEQTETPPLAPANGPDFYTALKRGDYGRVVETVIGPQSNTAEHGITVRWDLRRHRGKKMRLFVIDSLNQPWGFISVSPVTRFFVTGEEPVNVYVNGANTSGPFLGTPEYPYQTVTAGYNAATSFPYFTHVLKIHAGIYRETIKMDKPVTLNSEGGAAVIQP